MRKFFPDSIFSRSPKNQPEIKKYPGDFHNKLFQYEAFFEIGAPIPQTVKAAEYDHNFYPAVIKPDIHLEKPVPINNRMEFQEFFRGKSPEHFLVQERVLQPDVPANTWRILVKKIYHEEQLPDRRFHIWQEPKIVAAAIFYNPSKNGFLTNLKHEGQGIAITGPNRVSLLDASENNILKYNDINPENSELSPIVTQILLEKKSNRQSVFTVTVDSSHDPDLYIGYDLIYGYTNSDPSKNKRFYLLEANTGPGMEILNLCGINRDSL